MDKIRLTMLGCGSSGGVPRIGGNWGNCDPNEPKNRRSRCSLLIERLSSSGITRVLIDTSPDMRAQLLRADVGELDAVVFTHEHADHVHGLDDLRMVVINMRKRLPVYAARFTRTAILNRFGYAFETPEGSDYPPILEMNPLPKDLVIEGAGGTIKLHSFDVAHGRIHVRAIKINNALYTPDISAILEKSAHEFEGLDLWIIDALRNSPHPSHFSLDDAVAHIKKHAPKRAVLTNMHIDLDYETVTRETPDNVEVGYDMMRFEMAAD